jgi:hypothetical protein
MEKLMRGTTEGTATTLASPLPRRKVIMKRESTWKRWSDWRKKKAERLKSTRLMLRIGFPLEVLWNGRKRSEVKL